MKNLLNIILNTLLLFLSCSFAEEFKQPRVAIFHINGVNTIRTEADRNLNEIKKILHIESNIVEWDILYNPTTGNLAKDIWDALKQKRQEGKELSIDDYVITYMKSYDLHYPVDSPEYSKLKEEIKQHYIDDPSFVGRNLKEILDQFHDKIPPPYEDIVKVLREYNNTSKTKAYVLLIPHSQGNLYANQLWDVLVNAEHFPTSHLAVFGIANPADKIAGTVEQPVPYIKKYVTSDNDYVIKSLNFFSNLLPVSNPAMKANTHLNDCKDTICHSLIDAYIESDKKDPYLLRFPLRNMVVSLKKNLIEESIKNKDIRMFFNMGGKTKLDLFDNNGKNICTSKKGNNNNYYFDDCDENIFSYLHTDQLYDDYISIFAFTNNLSAGEYYILADPKGVDFPPYEEFYFNSMFRGRVKDGLMYNFDESCNNLKLNSYTHPYNDPSSPYFGFTETQLYASRDQYKCFDKIPELNRNGRFYIGKVILY